MDPTLYFDFIDHQGKKQPLLFKNPENIIIAEKMNEVLPCLKTAQAAVDMGYYAAGYLSYEAAGAFDEDVKVHKNSQMPLAWFGIFKQPTDEPLGKGKTFHATDWVMQTSREEYFEHINKIKQVIEEGGTDQVNYTIRMLSNFSGDPKSYYNLLSEKQASNYSAYLDIGDFSILSVSPELFFHIKDGKITTKPMKGTIGRGETFEEDRTNAEWLYHSEKNRNENKIIVDLMQEELGKIATPGTVQVPELFTIEKYPTVYQMTSTVTADISSETDITAIFQALFPCGSITGVPKVSTMNFIHELENTPRELYCGAMGYLTPEKEAVFNVPIRTVMIDHKTNIAKYGVGGGITRDSDVQEEYEEVLTKAKVLQGDTPTAFHLLETIGLVDGEYLVLKEHLQRIEQSANYFQYPINIEETEKMLFDFKKEHKQGSWKIRLLLAKDGEINIEPQEISPNHNTVTIALANTPVDKNDIFLYHKTTNRTVYKDKLQEHDDKFDVLLWNQDGELTEFTMGNLVVEMNEVLYTPPVSCGLLGGTYRKSLLEKGIITEKIIKVKELRVCSNIWFINSVREWLPVEIG